MKNQWKRERICTFQTGGGGVQLNGKCQPKTGGNIYPAYSLGNPTNVEANRAQAAKERSWVRGA